MKAKVPEMITLDAHHQRIEYLDMICLMALHEEFGFGAVRLRRYYDAISRMNDHYLKYNGSAEPLFGRRSKDGMTRMDHWAVKRDLMNLGFDYDKIVEEEKNGQET